MPQPPSANPAKPRHGLDVEPPLVKILVYTDDPLLMTPQNPDNDFGLAVMLQHLNTRGLAFGKLCVKWVSRYPPEGGAEQMLDELLEREHKTSHTFDEIWFFGFYQTNTTAFSLKVSRGGPKAELTASEVKALEEWMIAGSDDIEVGGGVLLTGDHNHPRPTNAAPGSNTLCPDELFNEAFLGRGRALGRCVPRAGQLRKWECKPTNEEDDSNNTIARSGFDTDLVPQDLILCDLNLAGDPDPLGEPHPVFRYKRGWLKVFPDHLHEGQLDLPKTFDDKLWPGQTRPHVIAHGVDRRHFKFVDLLMAYNGDLEDRGRIIADSSWHHYLNINIRRFPVPGADWSVGDQLGQFFANLALWLAPCARRYEMALAMLWRLTNYSALLEPLNDVKSIGREANSRLLQIASPCEIHELMRIIVPARFGLLYPPEGNSNLGILPSQEMLLGHILKAYHDEMIRDDTEDAYQPRDAHMVIELGFKEALKEQVTILQQLAEKSQQLIDLQN